MTAEQTLKKEFPDWPDWPAEVVKATVEMMESFARKCVVQDRESFPSRFRPDEPTHYEVKKVIELLPPFTFETKMEEI